MSELGYVPVVSEVVMWVVLVEMKGDGQEVNQPWD